MDNTGFEPVTFHKRIYAMRSENHTPRPIAQTLLVLPDHDPMNAESGVSAQRSNVQPWLCWPLSHWLPTCLGSCSVDISKTDNDISINVSRQTLKLLSLRRRITCQISQDTYLGFKKLIKSWLLGNSTNFLW